MLLALLWPLWLHLQRRRGVRVHNFAFARLLQQSSSPQQKRWRRWQQIPFMLLRLAAIALLVGSGAGPTWPR
ncbi:MAG: BatA domain-containing protein, partial [Polyangiales bacterium]